MEKLKNNLIYTHENDVLPSETPPTNKQLAEKINEIIDEIKIFQEQYELHLKKFHSNPKE